MTLTMSYPRATTSVTSRAPTAIMPSYMWPMAPAIAVLDGSRRVATLPVKMAEVPHRATMAVRVLTAYSPQRVAVAIWTQARANGGSRIVLRAISKASDMTIDICELPGHRTGRV
jgi:hypothetical protein